MSSTAHISGPSITALEACWGRVGTCKFDQVRGRCTLVVHVTCFAYI